jgi:ABC-type Fe3+/spermidine/putrescine transport system ATPase subunit
MRKEMQIELKDLQRRLGLAFLHVTHDQEEAFALSDSIIVMNDGVIEQQGDPETVYRRPANAYVADFIGGSNLVEGKATARAAGFATLETPFGRAHAPCASGVALGQRASLCIRPEQLVIGGEGMFRGTVRHAVFQGADWLVEVAAGSAVLRVRCPNEEPPAVGSTVSVGFEPTKAWIVAGALPQDKV